MHTRKRARRPAWFVSAGAGSGNDFAASWKSPLCAVVPRLARAVAFVLHHVLAADMRLKDIMSPTVESVGPGATLERAQARMRLRRLHHLVVIDRRQVVGILTDAALQVRQAEGVAKVEDAMSRHIVTGTPDMTVRQAANLMRGREEGALPVIDGERLVGIVTVTDLLDVLGRGTDQPAARQRRT